MPCVQQKVQLSAVPARIFSRKWRAQHPWKASFGEMNLRRPSLTIPETRSKPSFKICPLLPLSSQFITYKLLLSYFLGFSGLSLHAKDFSKVIINLLCTTIFWSSFHYHVHLNTEERGAKSNMHEASVPLSGKRGFESSLTLKHTSLTTVTHCCPVQN